MIMNNTKKRRLNTLLIVDGIKNFNVLLELISNTTVEIQIKMINNENREKDVKDAKS